MLELILGLLVFLGVHSTRIFAEDWRAAVRERMGPMRWKAIYSLASLLGLVLLIHGWSQARLEPLVLWSTPMAMKHLAALLTLLAFVLFVAAYVPSNLIKSRLHHPMVLGTKTWALAHLLANNTLADLLLFGGFLAWSVVLFIVSKKRDRRESLSYPPGRPGPTLVVLLIGLGAWAAFAFGLHAVLVGVRPFG